MRRGVWECRPDTHVAAGPRSAAMWRMATSRVVIPVGEQHPTSVPYFLSHSSNIPDSYRGSQLTPPLVVHTSAKFLRFCFSAGLGTHFTTSLIGNATTADSVGYVDNTRNDWHKACKQRTPGDYLRHSLFPLAVISSLRSTFRRSSRDEQRRVITGRRAYESGLKIPDISELSIFAAILMLEDQFLANRDRAGRHLWSAGFLGDLPFPPPLHSGAAPYSPHFIFIGSQQLDVKSGPNLFTRWPYAVCRRHESPKYATGFPLDSELNSDVSFLVSPPESATYALQRTRAFVIGDRSAGLTSVLPRVLWRRSLQSRDCPAVSVVSEVHSLLVGERGEAAIVRVSHLVNTPAFYFLLGPDKWFRLFCQDYLPLPGYSRGNKVPACLHLPLPRARLPRSQGRNAISQFVSALPSLPPPLIPFCHTQAPSNSKGGVPKRYSGTVLPTLKHFHTKESKLIFSCNSDRPWGPGWSRTGELSNQPVMGVRLCLVGQLRPLGSGCSFSFIPPPLLLKSISTSTMVRAGNTVDNAVADGVRTMRWVSDGPARARAASSGDLYFSSAVMTHEPAARPKTEARSGSRGGGASMKGLSGVPEVLGFSWVKTRCAAHSNVQNKSWVPRGSAVLAPALAVLIKGWTLGGSG
ncbi:hypothetical protein PR048_006007 [Dryococelus australis]|uniref:Uncharacterized protein n=1 Tax=Dryococelus australis TaxID=614101 RepID=A0ABQ9I9V2_9NEOP|nr:hypothetical protein PR048_006007 [Dryococelus australis]